MVVIDNGSKKYTRSVEYRAFERNYSYYIAYSAESEQVA